MKLLLVTLFLALFADIGALERVKQNFNSDWKYRIGDLKSAETVNYADSDWKPITLPHAFNEDEAFRVSIENLTDTIIWYRKHFTVDKKADGKYFIEFEGVRFGADVWINGQKAGISENGVMAFGFDITPYIINGKNVIAVRVDNSWTYRERSTGQRFQWNDKNFNANYGGIPKNVFLHISNQLYQTLPLYHNLGTTGVYIYGTHYDIQNKKVTLHAESEVRNDDNKARSFRYQVTVLDADGKQVGRFDGEPTTLQPNETAVVKTTGILSDVHFWSWGYGYLYTVKTTLKADDGSNIDEVSTRTGFRKTAFGEGKIALNDRIMMVHGYAQRTSNEWPGVGMGVPAWLSDYSNKLMVESGGNLVRWMHVTPWKQDVESCDRVGLPQAMPAGDAEHDVEGRRWEQRVELMRDAIIYNRNNPSIIFYECGNESISKEHMLEMKALRDKYDPFGGRAIGSREMLDIDEAEYGGEMLYVNKSAKHPMFAMEYNRDEGLRKYWDNESFPYHKEGDGPLYRGKPALEYNHNMDNFAISMVKRWYEYFVERPGTGKRVSSGGVKIIFSDTNTHHRGEANYRTSGVTDAMRIPKDAFFAHKVMWDGWVEPETQSTYIIGHWNYEKNTLKTVYVVSTGDEVELFLNGKSLGKGTRSDEFLFTFDKVRFEAGKLEAIAYKQGKESSRYALETVGKPYRLQLTAIENPDKFRADGADMALVQVEVVDKKGRRCPLDNRTIQFTLTGEAEWIGGIATPNDEIKQIAAKTKNSAEETKKNHKESGLLDSSDKESTFTNYIREKNLPVECGVNRVLLRSTSKPGIVRLRASAQGLPDVDLELKTEKTDVENYLPQASLKGNLRRGETPSHPTYRDLKRTVDIVSVQAGSNQKEATNSFDDNELTEWQSDGNAENAWITYHFKEKETVDEIVLKLTGWRERVYPLAIYAGDQKIWEGISYTTLGYVHIKPDKPVTSANISIKMTGPSKTQKETGDTNELAGGKAGELDRAVSAKGKVTLRIVEIDFLNGI